MKHHLGICTCSWVQKFIPPPRKVISDVGVVLWDLFSTHHMKFIFSKHLSKLNIIQKEHRWETQDTEIYFRWIDMWSVLLFLGEWVSPDGNSSVQWLLYCLLCCRFDSEPDTELGSRRLCISVEEDGAKQGGSEKWQIGDELESELKGHLAMSGDVFGCQN